MLSHELVISEWAATMKTQCSVLFTFVGSILFVFSSNSAALDNESKTFSYKIDSTKMKLVLRYKPEVGTEKIYTVDDFNECAAIGVYQLPSTDNVVIDGSCGSQGGQIDVRIFKPSSTGELCLDLLVSGEKPAPVDGNFLPKLDVNRLAPCSIPGSDRKVELLSRESVQRIVESEILQIKKSLELDEKSRSSAIKSFSIYIVAELSQNINEANVALLNDFGFYLEQNDRPEAAAILLTKICERFDDRVVAKLNLADASWKLGDQETSTSFYKSYLSQMTKLGKKKKVPQRVFMRLQ